MNQAIVRLTLRQVLGRRRTLLIALGAMFPVLIGFIFSLSANNTETPEEFVASALLGTLVVNAVLPIVALVFGTAVLGAEIDEGTAVYLLARPLSRAQIVVSKLLVAWAATAVVVVPAAALGAVIALEGSDGDGIVPAFVVALIAGSLAYSCLFIFLSVITSRALIVGLLYVFIWEGVITNLFDGTRLFSIREFTLAIADGITTLRPSEFEADLAPVQGILLMCAVILLATTAAIRALQRFEIGEST